MSLRLPRGVMFDLDGTLLDSLPGLRFSVDAAFSQNGIPVDLAPLPTLIGPPIRVIASRLREGLSEEDLDSIEKAFRSSYDTEGWRKTELFPSALEFIRLLLAAGRKLAVVTNKPRHIALRILEDAGVLSAFSLVVTRDSRTPPYPNKTEMIAAVAESFGSSTTDLIMLGDTFEDAEAAHRSGAGFIFMTHGYGEIPEDSDVSVPHRYAGFAELLPLLAEENTH